MSDTSILIGKIEPSTLTQFTWYEEQYEDYVAIKTTIDSLKKYSPELKIIVVLGTWCSDSKEQIPALFNIAKQAGIKNTQIELIGVDRKKHCPLPDISSLNIEYVPTLFIFYKGILKGKIIETPTNTLEEDILSLLKK